MAERIEKQERHFHFVIANATSYQNPSFSTAFLSPMEHRFTQFNNNQTPKHIQEQKLNQKLAPHLQHCSGAYKSR